MEPSELVRILRELPEAHLRLIPLTRKLIGKEGVDSRKVALYYKELSVATSEARAYVEATQKAVKCLINLVRW